MASTINDHENLDKEIECLYRQGRDNLNATEGKVQIEESLKAVDYWAEYFYSASIATTLLLEDNDLTDIEDMMDKDANDSIFAYARLRTIGWKEMANAPKKKPFFIHEDIKQMLEQIK